MGSKKITQLQLRGSVTDDLNLPSDDGIQSYRITALMIKNYILTASHVVTSFIADLAVTTAKLADLAVTAAKIATNTITPDKMAVPTANDYKFALSDTFRLDTAGYASGELAAMVNNSLTLTAGTWEIQGGLTKQGSGVEASSMVYFGVYTSNGNNSTAVTSTGLVATSMGSNFLLAASRGGGTGADFNAQLTQVPWILTVAAPTTIYAVGACNFTGAGNGNFWTQLRARRLA